jgi:dolichol-phosphate mannosyltransferase
MYDLTIIIPTLNEARSIRKTINLVEDYTDASITEILIVDDNSTDGTLDIIRDLAAVYPNIHLLVRLTDHGLSQSLADGFFYAAAPNILVLDADGQHPPRYIPPLYQKILDGNDIAIASRYMKGGAVWYVPWYRKILSWGATFLARFFFPSITDSGSGFFAFRKDVIRDAPLQPQGFRMLFEILGKGKWELVEEIPYTLQVREEGMSKLKVGTIISYVKQLWNLFKFSMQNKTSHGHQEIKRVVSFGVVGASGVIVNIGLLFAFTEWLGIWYVASSIISTEISILSNFNLNDLFTFRRIAGKHSLLSRLVLYHAACVGGMILMISTTIILTGLLGVWYIWSMLVGILLAFIWNFSVSRGVTWSEV